jgi:hypothetical protein
VHDVPRQDDAGVLRLKQSRAGYPGVEVIANGSAIKAGQEVIARVDQGDLLTVLRREGSWIGVETQTADNLRRGWVLVPQIAIDGI